MTRQEMLDRAVRGLRSQGWRPAMAAGACRYLTPDGLRCAWGHVDPEGTAGSGTTPVRRLSVGVAATLESADLVFAERLQLCHDWPALNRTAWSMEELFRKLAAEYNLIYPEEP